jgi:signal transduction histidine kinase/ActR/RegA family two-component response regulator
MPNWQELMAENNYHCYRASEVPERLQEIFKWSSSEYFVLAPLYLNGEFWGMFGADSSTRERGFSQDEAEILVAGVLVIASSISRNETFGKLNEARVAAMEATEAKGEFLSRMSHEIRTPINAIIGMTSIAKKTEDPERIRYCLDKVDGSSRHLLGLINDILDMSKIDSGKFEIINGEFDFDQMLHSVIGVADIKLSEKHQQLVLDSSLDLTHLMISDELRLSQVFTNLLTNASKFTPESGTVTIFLRQTPLAAGKSRLHVEIRDTGIGISLEKQKKLFQSFEQADGSITRTYGGTGLGLAICKRIVSLMGGDIWVESQEGQGSQFIFEVEVGWGESVLEPDGSRHLGKTKTAGKAALDIDSIDWSDKTILLVEDIDVNREIVLTILQDSGLNIVTATNGQEGLDAYFADPERYSLILMDVQMPVMDGITATQKIRERTDISQAKTVPIIAMTANAFKEDALSCLAAGMNQHIAKPFDMNKLFVTLASYLD